MDMKLCYGMIEIPNLSIISTFGNLSDIGLSGEFIEKLTFSCCNLNTI